MRHTILMLTVAAILAAVMIGSAVVAFAAAPVCNSGAPSDNGCKDKTTTTTLKPAGESSGFTETDTNYQRGNFNQGTTDTTATDPGPCLNPGGQSHGGPCQ